MLKTSFLFEQKLWSVNNKIIAFGTLVGNEFMFKNT
jgi:hypothetical protein